MQEESIDVTDGNTAGDTETTDTSASATAKVLATVPEHQSVLGIVLFYGIGFRLGARLGLAQVELVAASVFLLSLIHI